MLRKSPRVVCFLFVTVVASAVLVVGVDYWLFRSGTWSGWKLQPGKVTGYDEVWWERHVGALPPRGTGQQMVAPGTVGGRDGQNRDGAPGIDGNLAARGLVAYRLDMSSSIVSGTVLMSDTVHAWHIETNLPAGVAVQRIFEGQPGVAPPHPTLGGWELEILPAGFALNTLLAAAPLAIVFLAALRVSQMTVAVVQSRVRRRRGQCMACGYALTAGQARCPECGVQLQETAQTDPR